MSSARKRAAVRNANNEAEVLRQNLMLIDHQYASMKTVAETLAKECDEQRREIIRLRAALRIAADALEIADDWDFHAVQVNPPPEWKLPGGGENAADGWCSTQALADKLREMAAPGNPAGACASPVSEANEG